MSVSPLTPPTESELQVLEVLKTTLFEVVGEDYLTDIDIGMETSFADELELESIEFVELAEEIQEHYGARLDFVEWLSGMDLDEIIDMTVGQLVRFIDASLQQDG